MILFLFKQIGVSIRDIPELDMFDWEMSSADIEAI